MTPPSLPPSLNGRCETSGCTPTYIKYGNQTRATPPASFRCWNSCEQLFTAPPPPPPGAPPPPAAGICARLLGLAYTSDILSHGATGPPQTAAAMALCFMALCPATDLHRAVCQQRHHMHDGSVGRCQAHSRRRRRPTRSAALKTRP